MSPAAPKFTQAAPDPLTGAWVPTKDQLKRATSKRVPDLLAPNLDIVFCGINPGLYSGAVGHHFAGPGSRFWIALREGGFTPRLYSAFEEAKLVELGYGITNLVARCSAVADDLTADEYRAGATRLRTKIRKFSPRFVAILGLGAYRVGFDQRKAVVGLQPELIGTTKVWLLPNPSGLNAHHSDASLGKVFGELREASRR